MTKSNMPSKGITIKRNEAPKLCNSLAVSNEGFKDFVILDFLYSPVIHRITPRVPVSSENNIDVNIISSVMLPKEVAKHLHEALSEYLNNYVD